MNTRNNKLINDAINDILDLHPNFWDWSSNEVINLIIKEFRNIDNWFCEFVQDLSNSQIKAAVFEYLKEINFWNL